MSVANKRAQEDAPQPQSQEDKEDKGIKIKINIHNMLDSDPMQIAALGRHDEALLSKLSSFAKELTTATYDVNEERKQDTANSEIAALS